LDRSGNFRDEDSDDSGGGAYSQGRDLVEDLPPGPDNKVIEKVNREDTERSWLLGIVLGLLVLTLVVDLADSAWLSASAWAQVKPEIANIRTFLFQVSGVVIGFYFGSVRQHHSLFTPKGEVGVRPARS